MKFENYETYRDAATKHFGSLKDLKVPVEYMILTREMFDLFNGKIDFGPGYKPDGCQKCAQPCINTETCKPTV